MTARAPLAILLLAALALAAWLALRGERTPHAPRAETAAGDAAAAAPASPIQADLDARGSAATADAARVPVASRESAAPPAMLEILVVDAESKQPVADAELWVVAYDVMPPPPEEPRQSREYLWNIESRARELGKLHRTGPHGRVLLSDPGSGFAIARSEGRYGEVMFGPPPRDSQDAIRIELATDRTLRLRAIDPSGAPVTGLLLALRIWTRLQLQPGVPQWQRLTVPLAWSDAEGRLVVRHAQRMGPRIEPDPDSGRRTVDVVLLEGGFDDSARATFDADAWPQEELLVPVPASGAIVVELRGGSVERAAARLQLAGVPASGPGAPYPTPVRFGPAQRARFSPVALGHTYRITHAWTPRIACEVIGPVHAGQTVEAILVVTEEPPVFRYRLLDEQGRPLANRAPTVTYRIDGDPGLLLAPRTDASGVGFSPAPDHLLGRKVEWMDFEWSAGTERAPLRKRVTIDRALQPGTNDLGDVVLSGPALLAAGTVSGVPSNLLPTTRMFVEALVPDARTGALAWLGLEQIDRIWTEGDRFELRGACTAKRLRMTLIGQQLAPSGPFEFATGDRDVRIDLTAPCRIEMRLLLDRGFESSDLEARLSPRDAQRLPGAEILRAEDRTSGANLRERVWLAAARDRQQAELLQWAGLAPGRYRIELFAGVVPRPLLAPVDVLVRAGETAHAPDADLRGKLKRVRLELQDRAGVRLGAAAPAILLHRTDSAGDWLGERVSHGICEIVLAAPADLTVLALGFRRLDVDRLFEDRVIRLSPGMLVRLRFEPNGLPALDPRVSVRLDGPSHDAPPVRFRSAYGARPMQTLLPRPPVAVGSNGTASWRLEEPGEYSLQFQVDGSGARFVPDPQRIVVTDAPEQEFHVRVQAK